ncbi:hypothetical protein COO60DRAFT_1547377, partial [Scenedesmus sp. NREL 46B-D3]
SRLRAGSHSKGMLSFFMQAVLQPLVYAARWECCMKHTAQCRCCICLLEFCFLPCDDSAFWMMPECLWCQLRQHRAGDLWRIAALALVKTRSIILGALQPCAQEFAA